MYIISGVAFSWLFSVMFTPESHVGTLFGFIVPVIASIVTVLCVKSIFDDANMPFRDVMSLNKVLTFKNVYYGVVTGLCLWLTYHASLFVITEYGHVSVSNAENISLVLDSPLKWAIIPIVCFIAPVAEELIFRGLLLGLLNRLSMFIIGFPYSTVFSSIVISICFSLLHIQVTGGVMDVVILAVTFVLSMLACALTFVTKSLYPAVFLHVTYNTLSIAYAIYAN